MSRYIFNGALLLFLLVQTLLTWDGIIYDPRLSIKAICAAYWAMGIFIMAVFWEGKDAH